MKETTQEIIERELRRGGILNPGSNDYTAPPMPDTPEIRDLVGFSKSYVLSTCPSVSSLDEAGKVEVRKQVEDYNPSSRSKYIHSLAATLMRAKLHFSKVKALRIESKGGVVGDEIDIRIEDPRLVRKTLDNFSSYMVPSTYEGYSLDEMPFVIDAGVFVVWPRHVNPKLSSFFREQDISVPLERREEGNPFQENRAYAFGDEPSFGEGLGREIPWFSWPGVKKYFNDRLNLVEDYLKLGLEPEGFVTEKDLKHWRRAARKNEQ